MKSESMIFDFKTVILLATEIASRMNFLGYDTTYSVSLTEFSGPTVSSAIRGNTEKEGYYIVEHGMFHDARKGFEVNFTIGVPSLEHGYVSEWVKANISRIRVRDGLEIWETLYSVPTLEVYADHFEETANFYGQIPKMKNAFDRSLKNVKADMDGLIRLCQENPKNLKKIEDADCSIEEFNNLLVEMVEAFHSSGHLSR